jgi:hypothetical protein
MPTLGEFIARARAHGYTKQVIRIPELRARIVYLRRGVSGVAAQLVDLPPLRERRPADEGRSGKLCERAGIPKEDFG